MYLRSLNFSWSDIARLLGVSRMTVYRRRQSLGIEDNDIRMNMTQTELDEFLQQLRRQMPNAGQTVIMGRLNSMGYHICRRRVR